MAFVNEKEKLRTIDHERDAVLRPVAGVGRTNAAFFEFDWRGKTIAFSAYYKQEKIDEVLWDIEWLIFQIKVPKELLPLKEDYKALIFEALDTYGVRFGKKNVRSIKISSNNLADL